MYSLRFCCAIAATAALLASAPAPAQMRAVDPSGPQTVPPDKAETLAQAPMPDLCARAVRYEQNDKWLGVKRGDLSPLRVSAQVWLSRANIAASQGDDASCWQDLSIAEDMDTP
jgi:hypothetical protein